MKRRSTRQGSVEAGLREKIRKPMALLAMAGSLAVPAALASSVKAEKLETIPKIYGVVDDEAKQPNISTSLHKIDGIRQVGYSLLKESIWWVQGYNQLSDLPQADRTNLDNSMKAAQIENQPVMLSIWQGVDGAPVPKGPNQQRQFCDLAADLVRHYPQVRYFNIGNEITNPTFWPEQFKLDGTDAVAPAYEPLLAKCYDELKAVDPEIQVVGESLTSYGNDDPHAARSSHSPTAEIQNICDVYKESGRTKPIEDAISIHPYPEETGNTQEQDPTIPHPNSTTITVADYTKAEDLLNCFDGTGQPKPPIFWDEVGYNGQDGVPGYMSEDVQGEYYAKLDQMVACQPNSIGVMQFLAYDDPGDKKNIWKSGVYNPDGSPKVSLKIVRSTIGQLTSGQVTCPPQP